MATVAAGLQPVLAAMNRPQAGPYWPGKMRELVNTGFINNHAWLFCRGLRRSVMYLTPTFAKWCNLGGLDWPSTKTRLRNLLYLFKHFKISRNLPILLMTFLTCVWLKRPLDSIQSATTEMNMENSHMHRYGKADTKPFCKKHIQVRQHGQHQRL